MSKLRTAYGVTPDRVRNNKTSPCRCQYTSLNAPTSAYPPSWRGTRVFRRLTSERLFAVRQAPEG